MLLPEAQAIRAHFEARNRRSFFLLLWVFAALCLLWIALFLYEGKPALAAIPAAALLGLRAISVLQREDQFIRRSKLLVLSLLTSLLAFFLALRLLLEPQRAFPEEAFLLALCLLPFRWPVMELLIPLLPIWLATSGRHLWQVFAHNEPLAYGSLLAQLVLMAAVVGLVRSRTARERLDFLDEFRVEQRRHREQQRIREEVDDARRIQLSMLPQQVPRLQWMDVSSVSLPASEVGGDYYDYLPGGEGRQAVVVGDVAGHGLASGLMLSGVRSCLYLLSETPVAPAEVLRRLDGMVRHTGGHRLFVTMLYAVFSMEPRTITFSAAGHPPLLRYRAGNEGSRPAVVDELAIPALPLGTPLRGSLVERCEAWEPGDVFLLYTDGITETTNGAGEPYSHEQLSRALSRFSPGRGAREIRDAILADLWRFKGDGVQTDDITLMVIRMGT